MKLSRIYLQLSRNAKDKRFVQSDTILDKCSIFWKNNFPDFIISRETPNRAVMRELNNINYY